MKELSRIASAVQASTTMAIDAMFKQMKADGVDVIGFGAGEPDFNTPDNIKAAGIAAIEQNVTRYTPAAGTVELRQAVCGRMKADYGLEYKPSQVVVSSGAKHLVYLALRAVVNPGDEVIIPTPAWVSSTAFTFSSSISAIIRNLLRRGEPLFFIVSCFPPACKRAGRFSLRENSVTAARRGT